MAPLIEHFYRFREFTLDTEQRVLMCKDRPMPLAPKVFDTLLILVEKSGRIVEKDELMSQLWPDTFVEEANLTFNIQQLRKSLGDNARRPLYIETVARRGYRFIAPVTTDGKVQSTEAWEAEHAVRPIQLATTQSDTSLEANAFFRRSLQRWPAFLLVAIVLAVATGIWLLKTRSAAPSQATGRRQMLAVLPFKNMTGDTSQEYFSDGLTEEMIARLGDLDLPRLGVIARTSVMHYKGSQEPLDRICNELGVQYVIEGSVRRESDKVRITAQLIKVADQTHVWSRQYDRELSHILSLQGEIAEEVANEIQFILGEHSRNESVSPTPSSTTNFEAYDLYLKGQYLWNKRTAESLREAIGYFQQATEKDANYARAFAGLANSYALMSGYTAESQGEWMPKARSAALRAL